MVRIDFSGNNDWSTCCIAGMSVKIGNVINGQKTYVVGAPRSSDVGQVCCCYNRKKDVRKKQWRMKKTTFSSRRR